MTTTLTTDQLATAVKYLGSAQSALNCYGNEAKEAILAAKLYAALSYREGDIDKLIQEIRDNHSATIED